MFVRIIRTIIGIVSCKLFFFVFAPIYAIEKKTRDNEAISSTAVVTPH